MNMSALPPFAAIVVAAGKGLRAGQDLPKQFATWRGKPLLRHSVEAFARFGAREVIVVIPENAQEIAAQVLSGLDGVRFVIGADTRQGSVQQGLQAISDQNLPILIHDAARPDVPETVVEALLEGLRSHEGAIPVLPIVDSLIEEASGIMGKPADRDRLRRVQTPQAFRGAAIREAHEAWVGPLDAGDDAQVLVRNGGTVALVEGHARLAKVTFAEDFMTPILPVRIGSGFDVHRLAQGESLWLCGVTIDSTVGLVGHSDADVALHALTDAVLGALAEGDIGTHFPPSDPQWRGASSDRFLQHAVALAQERGYAIGNVDLTLICEVPKIGPHREAMRKRLAELLGVDTTAISVKATTTERLGFTGREEGIAAQASVTLIAQTQQGSDR